MKLLQFALNAPHEHFVFFFGVLARLGHRLFILDGIFESQITKNLFILKVG
tara:strand:- start:1068 stop:1220 length:153 start_codon:yes stop_codon:yes gene_type:complete